ncbi:MAG: hypothetical protein HYX22_02440 [Candidatus Yanofskybacteria bacterium]|nr:hypothetical protein [Candidatus Yanofskybacteria bacterium]
MKEKFEIKLPEKKPKENEPAAEGEPRQGREIETWEGEGGTVAAPSDLSPEDQKANEEASGEGRETKKEASAEVPETVVEESKVEISWREILIHAKEEFPDDVKRLIDTINRGDTLNSQQQSRLDKFSHLWFRETFGIVKKKKQPVPQPIKKKKQLTEEELTRQRKQIEENKIKRSEKKQGVLQGLAELKRKKMGQLHRALRNLDAGESVEEFIDETRRVVYFDEENSQYFVEENGTRKVLGIGDIVSDYAWGIKYFPDSRMADATAYRTIAKKILTNETRRDLEKIHDRELVFQEKDTGGFSFVKFKQVWEKAQESEKASIMGQVGFIAEIAVREFLSRVGYNYNLNFVVSRATIEEDRYFKYDFKIRIKHKIRGIDVESNSTIKTIGLDLKTEGSRKTVHLGKTKLGKRVVVDEIFILKIPGNVIGESFLRWLEADEPSGGPERFLPPELKKTILKAVTEKLVDIPQEVYDQIV